MGLKLADIVFCPDPLRPDRMNFGTVIALGNAG